MNSIATTLYRGLRISNNNVKNVFRFASSAAAATEPKAVETSTKRRHTKVPPEEAPKGPFNIYDAVEIAKSSAWANFDESLDIVINTGLDPRKPNQNIKGMAKLPNGRGKKVRVCVIAQGDDADKAKRAGADVAGADEVIQLIQQGDVNFQSVIATPEMMAQVGKIGKVSIFDSFWL